LGGLKKPLAVRHGSREGAALMSKKLAFRQGLVDGAAMDGDERAGAPFLVPLVNGIGEHLLSGARLAFQEHRDVAQARGFGGLS
jgi:hypothetical protein